MKDGLGPGTGLANIIGEINVDTIITSDTKLFFRDSGLSIHSSEDGKIAITSDGSADDAIKLDGPATVLLGEKSGGEGLTIKDSDDFPVSVMDSKGDLALKGRQKRTTTN